MKNIEAVIFDMDGLMVNTEPIWVESSKEVFQRFNMPFPDDLVEQVVGLKEIDVRKKFKKIFGSEFDYDIHKKLVEQAFKSRITNGEIELKKGIFEVLEFLNARNVKRTIATSSRTEYAQIILRRTGLAEYFDMDRIVTGDQVSKGKPHPEIYRAAASRIYVEPYRCIALEDSNPGVQSAVASRYENDYDTRFI